MIAAWFWPSITWTLYISLLWISSSRFSLLALSIVFRFFMSEFTLMILRNTFYPLFKVTSIFVECSRVINPLKDQNHFLKKCYHSPPFLIFGLFAILFSMTWVLEVWTNPPPQLIKSHCTSHVTLAWCAYVPLIPDLLYMLSQFIHLKIIWNMHNVKVVECIFYFDEKNQIAPRAMVHIGLHKLKILDL